MVHLHVHRPDQSGEPVRQVAKCAKTSAGSLVGLAEIAGLVFDGVVTRLVEGAPAIVDDRGIRGVEITEAAVAGNVATLRLDRRGTAANRARA